MSDLSNIHRFIDWLSAEKARGLVDLKGTCVNGEGFVTRLVSSDLSGRDDLCGEFLRALHAPVIPNVSLL